MATKAQALWSYRRSPLRFQSDRHQERLEEAEARNLRNKLIKTYYTMGNVAEAERLQLVGSAGYPDVDNRPI